jgi:hypothetical protein
MQKSTEEKTAHAEAAAAVPPRAARADIPPSFRRLSEESRHSVSKTNHTNWLLRICFSRFFPSHLLLALMK